MFQLSRHTEQLLFEYFDFFVLSAFDSWSSFNLFSDSWKCLLNFLN
ncbi:hypothetical protein CPter291_2616 [Collimonas pratensis]|uniref:Uncharacterized protein n=1 Tax=Collimonas pratensis TaxID=279113 RepID=A0ABN4MCG2_9BURK|nr:hypothetical protein CPter291_2616 [Collimonas pratensis]